MPPPGSPLSDAWTPAAEDGSLTPEQAKRFQDDGFLVLPDYASATQVRAMLARADQLLDAFDPATVPRSVFSTVDQKRTSDAYFLDSGNHVSFFFEEDAFDETTSELRQPKALSVNKLGHALHDLDPTFRAFSRSKKIARTLRTLGMRDPTPVQSMYIFKQPGIGGEVTPHQDSTFLHTTPRTCAGVWVALEDCTKANGCLWALRASHKEGVHRRMVLAPEAERPDAGTPGWRGNVTFEGEYPTFDLAAFEPLETKAGTMVLLHGENVHYSAPNKSDASRHAYSVHFVEADATWDERNWLQRREDFPFVRLGDGEE